MPHFPDNPLAHLALEPIEPDRTVRLDVDSPAEALARVDRLLAAAAPGERLLLRFPAPSGDGRETLFQPLGRHLLEARRRGRLKRCLPAPDGAGYLIQLPEGDDR